MRKFFQSVIREELEYEEYDPTAVSNVRNRIKTSHGTDYQNAALGSYATHQKLVEYNRKVNSRSLDIIDPSTFEINRTVVENGVPIAKHMSHYQGLDDRHGQHFYCLLDLQLLASYTRI